MSVYDVLAQAIEERRVVTFTYDGFLRVVEPFLLGTTTAGRSALRAYQTAGGSRSGTVPGWHLFSLGKIVGLATCQNGQSRPLVTKLRYLVQSARVIFMA